MVCRQQQFRRHDILAHGADILPAGQGGAQHQLLAFQLRLLHHDHRIGPARQRIAGIHRRGSLAHLQARRMRVTGPDGVGGA